MRLRPLVTTLTVLTALTLMTGCGATARRPGAPRVATPLVDGEAIYRLRYNPPPCLADQPELHAEAETPAGWERVALESADPDVDLVASLLARFGRAPRAVVPVQGEIVSATRSYPGQHAARVLRVMQVDPALEPAPDETPSDDDPPDDAAPEPESRLQPPRARSRHSMSCTSPRRPR